jgi:hypothetical protein
VSTALRWQPAAWLVLAAAMVVMGINMGVRQTFGLFLSP